MSEEHQSGRNIKERRDPDDLCCILPIGPLPGTVTDFWRMVWQDNVEVIVMLINLMEGDTIRCQQYWPDCGYENYGPFQVTITHCKQYPHYCVRQLHLKVFILQLTHSNIPALLLYISLNYCSSLMMLQRLNGRVLHTYSSRVGLRLEYQILCHNFLLCIMKWTVSCQTYRSRW